MKKKHSVLFALIAAGSAAHAFAGYTLTTLASFNGSSNGENPEAGVTLSGSTLYGTTTQGGAHGDGEVFSVPVTGGTPTVLASFNGTSNGNYPVAGLTLSGSTLYGTTQSGGAHGDGEVFSLPVTGGTPTVLASFNGSTNGLSPQASLTLSGSTLYGTTLAGGANGDGEVFSVPVTGGTPTVLASFNGSSNGSNPEAGLTLSGSTLYGTTLYGGASGFGEVFSVPVTGGTPTVLASFNGSSNGESPQAGLTLSGSTLYGTTEFGGASSAGVVFSVPVSGGTPTVLTSFNGSTNGSNPSRAGLTLSGGTLYGTAGGGPSGFGEVFSLPVTGGTPTVLASFNDTNGEGPDGLTLSGSTLYGTTLGGEPSGAGTVFSLSTIPNPIISLSSSAPTAFGNSLAALTLTGGNGNYVAASKSFSPTYNGYVSTSAWNPTGDTEIFALDITDSTPGSLSADLALLAAQIDDGTYTGFTATASTIDPTGGDLTNITPGGFNFFITINDPTLGASLDYFGFDLSQLNGSSDTLTATAVAVVPEPASLSLFVLGGAGLLSRRRSRTAR